MKVVVTLAVAAALFLASLQVTKECTGIRQGSGNGPFGGGHSNSCTYWVNR